MVPKYDDHILINNWYPVTESWPASGWPYLLNSVLANEIEMQPAPASDYYGDMYSISGLNGQNNSFPGEKWFDNHRLVLYNNTYYDPSYGVTYNNTTDFANTSLFGVTKSVNSSKQDHAKTATSNDIKFE